MIVMLVYCGVRAMGNEPVSNSVLIEHIDGQWAVQIVEDGKVSQQFETEQFAQNFAAGQKVRLKLPLPHSVKPPRPELR